jgi:anti-sigma-K factor RskA
MNDHDQLREQMWDLVYDLVTPEEKAALCDRIKSDPKVARLYAEVSLEADLISQAAKVADTSVTLPQVEPRREKVSASRAKETAAPARGAGISRSLQWLAALAASALAVVLTVGTVGTYWQAETVQPQEQLVISIFPDQPGTLVASLPTRFRIETKDPSGKPASATITAQLADAAGASLYEKQVQTDSEGKALFSVPGPAVAVGTSLRIWREVHQQFDTPSPRASERAEDVAEVQKREEVLVDALLPVEPEPIKAPPLFNKDQYVPGEEAHFRVVPQFAISRKSPDVSTLAFRLQMPDGRFLEPTEAVPVDGTGIVTGRFQLPPDAPAGRYLFAVQGGARVQPDEEAGILVAGKASQLPGTPLFAGDSSALGGFFGGGAGQGVGRGGPAGPAPGGLGGGKPSEMRENLRDRAMKLAARKGPQGEAAAGVAGGQRDGGAAPAPPGEPAPMADAALSLDAMDKLREKELAQEQPSIRASQIAGRLAQLEVDGKQATGTLNVDVPPEFAGKPVRIEAYFNQVLLGKKLLDAEADKSRDKASESADGGQTRMAALTLDPWVDGEKVDLVFQDASSPSSHPVQKQIEVPSLFDVNLSDAKESYAPGETVRLLVEIKNRFSGSAVPNADLGVVVKPVAREADEVTQQLAKAATSRLLSDLKSDKAGRSETTSDEERRIAMSWRKTADAPAPAQVEAAKDKNSTKPAPPAADGSPPAPAPVAADVAPTPDDSAVRSAGEPAARPSLAEMDDSQPLAIESPGASTDFFAGAPAPIVISNEVTVQRALQDEQDARSARQAKMALWRAGLGRLLLALGVVMLLALGVAFAVQRPAKAMVWIPSLGIALASFAVGMVWLQGQPRHPGHEVAQSSYPAARGAGEHARPMSPASVPPESDVALMTDSEVRSNYPLAGPESGAAASNQTNGVEPRGGALAEGIVSDSTSDLRQRSGLDRHDPLRWPKIWTGCQRSPNRQLRTRWNVRPARNCPRRSAILPPLRTLSPRRQCRLLRPRSRAWGRRGRKRPAAMRVNPIASRPPDEASWKRCPPGKSG